MKVPIILFCILAMSIASCKKNKGSLLPSGIYTEVTSSTNKTTLNFLPMGIMIKGETGSNSRDTFNVSISGNKISLKHTSLNYPATSFDFRLIDQASFEIEYLGMRIPETPKFMSLYKK